MNNIIAPFFVPIKISQTVLDYAKKFAAEQTTPEKANRVLYNTIAVGVAASYLHWMEFKVDLAGGESWNAAIRRFNDVADLVLPDIGTIECRPLLPGENAVSLPSEVRENRIGCLLVQLEEEGDKAKILGFFPAGDRGNLPEAIRVEDLQSVELLEDLEIQAEIASRKKTEKAINLSEWLDNVIDRVWRTVEEVLGEEKTVLALGTARRGLSSQGVVRAESINLGTSASDLPLDLVVGVFPKVGEKIDVYLQVHPTDSPYLPVGLKFAVLDAFGKTLREDQANNKREWLQLNISGKPGEKFSVKVELGRDSMTKNFLI